MFLWKLIRLGRLLYSNYTTLDNFRYHMPQRCPNMIIITSKFWLGHLWHLNYKLRNFNSTVNKNCLFSLETIDTHWKEEAKFNGKSISFFPSHKKHNNKWERSRQQNFWLMVKREEKEKKKNSPPHPFFCRSKVTFCAYVLYSFLLFHLNYTINNTKWGTLSLFDFTIFH